MASKGQKFKNYTVEFKEQVVKERLEGISLNYLTSKYNIPSRAMIVRWTREFKENGVDAFVDNRGKASKENNLMKGRPKTKFNSLEEENKYLKLENEYLK